MSVELTTRYLPFVDELFTTESKKELITNTTMDGAVQLREIGADTVLSMIWTPLRSF